MEISIPNLRAKKSLKRDRPQEAAENVPANAFGLKIPFTASDAHLLEHCEHAVPLQGLVTLAEELLEEKTVAVQRIGKKGRDEEKQEKVPPRRWATCGVVVEIRNSDELVLAQSWEGTQVMMYITQGAAAVPALYSVVCIEGAAVERGRRGEAFLRVNAARQIQVVGRSKSVGRCSLKGCRALVEEKPGNLCFLHSREAHNRRVSARSELNAAAQYVPISQTKKEGNYQKKQKISSSKTKSTTTKSKTAKLAASTASTPTPAPAAKATKAPLAEQAAELLKKQVGLGARSLAALVGSEAHRIGPPEVTATSLRAARSSTKESSSSSSSSKSAVLHPNSWQLYQTAPASVPEKADDYLDLIEFDDLE